jgi:hypothetical protein
MTARQTDKQTMEKTHCTQKKTISRPKDFHSQGSN